MIKIFRKIRRTMLKENQNSPPERRSRAGKFLLYAVGEIVLVVIGILIALSINNQNEEKKNQDLVFIYKTELLNDLLLDASHFQYHLDLAEEENRLIDSIRDILHSPSSGIATLNEVIKGGLSFIRKEPYIMLASTEYPIISDNTFISLQNSGQITLLDNDLQAELVSFYGYTKKYSFMIQEIQNNKNELYYDYIKTIPFLQSELNVVGDEVYEQLWNNVEWNTAQIQYVTLVNTYYELNLKTIFFNSMRLYKTNVLIEQLQGDINSGKL